MNQETVNALHEADVQDEVWWKGANLSRLAAIVFASGWTPLLLYCAVVPEYGNPVALGLLAFSVVALGLGTVSIASALLGRGR